MRESSKTGHDVGGGRREEVDFLLLSESIHPSPLSNYVKGENSKKPLLGLSKGSEYPTVSIFEVFTENQ